jgi:TRAP-type C4-dicarboxylate transport system permease small subunit
MRTGRKSRASAASAERMHGDERATVPDAAFPRAARLLRIAEDIAMVVVVIGLFATMAITVVDVVMRYAFNAPLAFAYDLIGQYLLVASFFLALSYTLRVEGHMNVDVVLAALKSERARAALRAVGDMLALAFFLALLYAGCVTAFDAWTRKETLTGSLPLPIWISQAFVPLGVALLALRLAYRLASDVRELRRRSRRRAARAAR